jgi:hypothetical protein
MIFSGTRNYRFIMQKERKMSKNIFISVSLISILSLTQSVLAKEVRIFCPQEELKYTSIDSLQHEITFVGHSGPTFTNLTKIGKLFMCSYNTGLSLSFASTNYKNYKNCHLPDNKEKCEGSGCYIECDYSE